MKNKFLTTYDLYEEYSGLCVEEKDYFRIINSGLVPNNLENIFDGEFTSLKSASVFEGSLYKTIINSGAVIFLHKSDKEFSELSKAYFFYQDFLVIIPVGKLNYSSNVGKKNDSYTYYKYTKSNCKPIIIPINEIKKISTSINGNNHFIVIEYIDEKKDFINLFKKEDNYLFSNVKNLVSADNWSLTINKNTLKLSAGPINIQYLESHIKKNFDIIINKINLLINSSTNFKKISEGIYKKFNSSVSFELDELKYNKNELLKSIIKNKTFIKDVIFKKIVDEYDSLLLNYSNECKKLKDEYDKCVINYNNLSIIGKIKNQKNLDQSRINYENFKNNNLKELKYCEKKLFEYLISDNNSENLHNYDYDHSIDFYLECLNKNITIPEDKEQALLFEMIYKKNGINNFEQAINFYKEGKSNYNKTMSKKDKITKSKERMDYIIKYNIEKELANVIGYDKYLTSTIKEYETSMNMANAANMLGELAELKSNIKHIKSDPAIFGGISNGIAGPVAGIMTANEIQRKNNESEINARINSERNQINAHKANVMSSIYNSEAYSKNKEIKQIFEKICDIEHRDEYFKYLKCTTNYYEIIDKNIVKINVNIERIKDVILNDLNFILDGSLKINIILNDKIIGDAYLNAPGYDDINLMLAGFNKVKEYEIIGVTDIDISNCNDNLKFEFIPYNLWIIEHLYQVTVVGDISKSYLKIIEKLEERKENTSKEIIMILKECNRAVTPMEIEKFLPDKSVQKIAAILIGMEKNKYVISEIKYKKTYYCINNNYVNNSNNTNK